MKRYAIIKQLEGGVKDQFGQVVVQPNEAAILIYCEGDSMGDFTSIAHFNQASEAREVLDLIHMAQARQFEFTIGADIK